MPDPKRLPPLASIDVRICRWEIQRVLRKHHGPISDHHRVDAGTCLGMLVALLNSSDPGYGQLLAGYWTDYPSLFADLAGAIVRSEKRIRSMASTNPERVVEEHRWALRDVATYKKLIEAVPHVPARQLAQIRTRIAANNRVLEYWQREFSCEGSSGPYVFRLSDDGTSVDVYYNEKPTA